MATRPEVKSFYRSLVDILDRGYLEDENPVEILDFVEEVPQRQYPLASYEDGSAKIKDYAIAVSEIQSEIVSRMLENDQSSELEMMDGNFTEILENKKEADFTYRNNFYKEEELFQSGRLVLMIPENLDLKTEPPSRLNPYQAMRTKDPKYEEILFETAESIADELSSKAERQKAD